MDSAFDTVTPADAAFIRKRFLAGDTMAEIRRGMDVSAKVMRAMRDEIFDPLSIDPQALKALANGPVLNPLEVTRFRHRPHQRPHVTRPGAAQVEMFPA